MNSAKKPKIVALMPHGPPYDYQPQAKPDISWTKPDGSWVGFWPREWMDILGEAILKKTDRYDWEVWQPDYRADKLYSKVLDTGVAHLLFPAEARSMRMGIWRRDAIFSDSIIERLKKEQEEPILLMFYATRAFQVPLYYEILKIFGPRKKFPILMRSGGQFKDPLTEIWGLHRPLSYLDIVAEHFQLKSVLRYADVISEQTAEGLGEVKKLFGGRVEKLTIGCDFDFWKPVPSVQEKASLRKELNISEDKTVFFASGNFVPFKQLDRLIEIFRELQDRNDFFLIVAGHGNATYTKVLASLIDPLAKQGKALLHPYATGERLRNIYWASDLYASVSMSEGGPASVMKAMACGLPVLSTPTGETADRMKEHSAGKFIPIKDYAEWSKAIAEILNGRMPRPIDLAIAREAYDWPNVAGRFIRVYDDLFSAYYGER